MGIFSPEQTGTLTQTSTTGPPDWLSALYQQGSGAAQNYFQNYQSNPLTQQGLGFLGNLSQNPNQYGYQPVLDEFQKTVQGDYLYGGSGFDAYMEAAQNKIQPMVQGAFNQAGRLNSGLTEVANTQALADSFAQLYGQERGRQQGALAMAPQMAQFGASPGELAYQTGQMSDAEYETQLDDYLRRLTGVGSTYSKSTSEQPLFGNDLLELLGGASSVAGLIDAFGGSGTVTGGIKSLWNAITGGDGSEAGFADFAGNIGPLLAAGGGSLGDLFATGTDNSLTLGADAANTAFDFSGAGGDVGFGSAAGDFGAAGGGGGGGLPPVPPGATNAISGLGGGASGISPVLGQLGGPGGAAFGLGAGALPATFGTSAVGAAAPTGFGLSQAFAPAASTTGFAPAFGSTAAAAPAAPGALSGLASLALPVAFGAPLAMGILGSIGRKSGERDAMSPVLQSIADGPIQSFSTSSGAIQGVPFVGLDGQTYVAPTAAKNNPKIGDARAVNVYNPATGEFGTYGVKGFDPGSSWNNTDTTASLATQTAFFPENEALSQQYKDLLRSTTDRQYELGNLSFG